jgi:hypothetical protein
MLFTGERGVNAAGDGFDVRGRTLTPDQALLEYLDIPFTGI